MTATTKAETLKQFNIACNNTELRTQTISGLGDTLRALASQPPVWLEQLLAADEGSFGGAEVRAAAVAQFGVERVEKAEKLRRRHRAVIEAWIKARPIVAAAFEAHGVIVDLERMPDDNEEKGTPT